MSDEIVLTVNGKPHKVQAASDTPLLYVLRNELGVMGPHFGCGEEKCGACMVLIGDQAKPSCKFPVSEVGRTRITTLEGLIEEGEATPSPTCFYRGTSSSMRLLPQWDDHHHSRVAMENPSSELICKFERPWMETCVAAVRICESSGCERAEALLSEAED